MVAVAADADLESDSWGLIFEDDVAFHDALPPPQFHALLQEAFNASASSSDLGFLFLGLCNPRCAPNGKVVHAAFDAAPQPLRGFVRPCVRGQERCCQLDL
jgi:hypothetical protein